MRIALCQIDPTVGDLAGNAAKIVAYARRAEAEGAALALFPELCLTGYPPRDLVERPQFLRDVQSRLDALAGELPPAVVCLVGFVQSSPAEGRPGLYNAMALLREGRVEAVAHKRLLPTYDVFDEQRYFAPGDRSLDFILDGTRFGLTICEDIWADQGALRVHRYAANPVAELCARGIDVLLNAGASPFTLDKRVGRAALMADVARAHGVPVVMVNQVGGNDELLFDGQSAMWDAEGKLIARAPSFEEALCMVELTRGGVVAPAPESDAAAALAALALGTRDYVHKTGFSKVLLGLSGGIDSALVAAIAARALGPANVLGVAMPSRYSSEHSVTDAEELARNLGIGYRKISIDGIFQGYLDHLGPEIAAISPDAPKNDVTFENVQARIRGNVLMALSNRLGRLLLTTGNKSELACGYCTLYGDMAGALAVISDLPKMAVYAAAREYNRQAGRAVIPESTLTKPPSAELRPNQTDQDSLPPYDLLDAVLELYVEDHLSVEDIVAKGFDAELVRRVARMVTINEYKRKQMPPGLIITSKAFGSGRRYPIAQRYGL
jgi:NAD+ synthase (glutamine-hydrolysing)